MNPNDNYGSINLTSFLQPVGAPVSSNGTAFISGFQVDSTYDRNSITTTQIDSISANKVTAGTFIAAVNVGTSGATAYVKLDGANNRIVVNDGTVDRIYIGYALNGF